MKWNTTVKVARFIALSSIMLHCSITFAQIEYRKLNGAGTALLDINNSGKAVKKRGVYNFAANTTQPIDAEAIELSGINNNGDLIGLMPWIVNGEAYVQGGFKKDGVWTAIGYLSEATVEASVVMGQISENGGYIAGQMSSQCCDQQAFLYNVANSELERIADDETRFSAGYSVNDSGTIGGWYDTEPGGGTLRVPAYMTTGSVKHSVPDELPQVQNINQVSSINNGNAMVGDRDGVPFIYDLTTNTFTVFEVPEGYDTATFTGISDNGVAIGYCQGGFSRDAIVYHPSLGLQPVLVAEILIANQIEISSFDGKLGTAIAISPDGNFICGWENGNINSADGWAINFNNLLLSSCYIQCLQDIVLVSLDGPTEANYSLSFNCSENTEATIVLVAGLPSGSLFPYGTTEVTHNLVAADGTVLNTCTFTVTVNEFYCIPTLENAEAITRVKIGEIDNTSAADSAEDYEDFTAVTATVTAGSSYEAIFEGNTGGEFTDVITIFADWNKDGSFSEDERTEIGTLTNSTGTDGIQASGTLTVPSEAITGPTTLRVIKTFDLPAETSCYPGSGYGQTEDYTLNVEPLLGTEDFTNSGFRLYPNPTKGILNISGGTMIKTVSVFNILGQEMLSQTIDSATGQIDISALPSGNYMVKASSETAVKTFKIIKN